MAYDFFYGLVPQEGQGTGFIIDKAGHILTNYHVIADAREVWVTLHNRKKYRATIVGTDRAHDLAIVQIKTTDLVPMTLGDSTTRKSAKSMPSGTVGLFARSHAALSVRSVR
jgi:S1-C subfamily serine protease